MPYYRKRYQTKKTATKKGYVLKKDLNQAIARKVNRMAERNYHDISVVSTIDTTGIIWCASDVPVGTGDTQRIGDKFNPLSLEVCGRITADQLALSGSSVRMIVFKWKAQSNVDALNCGKILQNITVTTAPFEFYNHDNRAKFTVLCDKVYEVYGSGEAKTRLFKFKCPIKGKQMNYAGATLDHMNGVYIMFISDTTVSPPQVEFKSRLHYVDF